MSFSLMHILKMLKVLKKELQSFSPIGPYKWPIFPVGRATDWNFSECTRLWPLYTTFCIFAIRQIARIVPSTNPTQLFTAAPIM